MVSVTGVATAGEEGFHKRGVEEGRSGVLSARVHGEGGSEQVGGSRGDGSDHEERGRVSI